MLENPQRNINCGWFTRNNNAVAVHADRNGNVLFNCREILIEFTEEPDVVVKTL